MKKIAIIFNGGTITMKLDDKIKAAVPSLSSDEIMDMVLGIEKYAKLETYTFSNLPSPHITPEIMLELSDYVKRILDRDDIDGVVVTHGTDTLEETAYFLHLTIESKKPIIFTGSMRSGSELSYDGPFNLAASVCAAISEESRGRGVLVCFNGDLNCASEVTKANSMNVNAFKTPNFGPIGVVDNDMAIFYRNSLPLEHFDIEKIDGKVSLLKCVAGMDSSIINFCIDNGDEGIVIEGLGRGNIPKEMIQGVQRAINHNIPVILVSRCFEGRVHESYGYDGGGKQLKNMGVIFGDNLNGQKARIKLIVALSKNKNVEYIRKVFEKNLY